MPQTLLQIYRIGGAPITASTNRNGFVFSQGGKVGQIFRVDFFDQPGEGIPQKTIAVVACDPAASQIVLHSNDIDLALGFVYIVGQPNIDGDELGLKGSLQFQGGRLGFFAGLFIDNARVDVGPGPFPFAGYSQTFDALINAPDNPFPAAIDPGALPGATQGWDKFELGNQIFHRILNLDAGAPDGGTLPMLTLARDIPAVIDATGIRRLPAPFAIPVALASMPGFDQAALRVVQNPNTPDFVSKTGPATVWTIQIGTFLAGTIADFWQRCVYERYVGALESVASAEPVSLLPRFTAADGNWLLRFPATAQPASAPSAPGSLTPDGNRAQATLSCDAFRTWDGTGMQTTATLSTPQITQPIDKSQAYVQFSATPAGSAAPGKIRLGSLDLIPGDAPSISNCLVHFETPVGDFSVPRIALLGAMPLSNAQPGGQDEPADPVAQRATEAVAVSSTSFGKTFSDQFTRVDPLVIPYGSPEQAFQLSWNENSVRGFNQELTLTLKATSTGGGTNNVMVIDPQPLTVALVQLPALASAASAASAEVAQWSNSFPEGPSWRIAAGAGKFQMLLPPQGVGEEMVKNEVAADGRTMQFRLTPPASAALQSTAQAQRFAEPGWNLRRVLGFPGERAPGAIVQGLSFEMLYGLTCTVGTPGLRMSEMFSRLGGFAGPLVDGATGQLDLNSGSGYTQAQKDAFFKLNQSWAQQYVQLLSRLGVMELWTDETAHDLVLTDGVSCTLRNTAQLAYPVGTQPIDSKAPKQPKDGGLRGGIAWPFDSQNVYEALWSNPNSTAALFANPRFTALGGSGVQRASFSNGNIIIEAETSVGSLLSVTVTLRGYIGNLRHPATHVVVYTRSVRPSRQFYGEQPLLEGRPILRKTSEYVKITQAARSYPETGTPNPGTGPVLGAEFKTIQINVDSAWGSDLGPGWRVPLWRRDALPADVYPRPHVLLNLAVDPATGTESRKCEIQDPEKLYFYTNPSLTTPNTDDWPMVEFVDFCNNQRSRSIDNPQVKDYSREPGFGQFTYTIDGDAPQVNVVAQRTKNPMASRLTNVTFMRGSGPKKVTDEQAAAGRLHDHMHNVIDELVKVAATNPANLQKALTDRLTQLGDIVQSYGNDLTQVGKLDSSGLCASLGASAAKLVDRAAAPLAAPWNNLVNTLTAALNSVQNPLTKHPEALKHFLLSKVDQLYAGLQSSLSPLLADLSVANAVAQSLLDVPATIVKDLTTLQGEITDTALKGDQFRDRCQAIAQRCADDIDIALGDVQQLLQSAAFLFGLRIIGDAAAQVATLQQAVEDFSAAFDQEFHAVTALLVNGAADDINTEIDKLKALLPPAKVNAALDAFKKTVAAAANPNTINAKLTGIRDQLRSKIAGVVDNSDPAVYVAAFTAQIDLIQEDLAGVTFDTLIGGVKTTVQNQVSSLCKQLMGTVNQAAAALANLLGANLNTAIQNLPSDVGDAIQAIEGFRTTGMAALDGLVQQCRSLIDPNNIGSQAADSAIAVLRGFGAPPAVPNLNFNLPAIGYFFDGTQAVAVSNQLAAAATEASTAISALSQLGLTLPTTAVFDRLVPGDLSNLGISDLLPNIAGLDLSKLFGGTLIPDSARDNIHVSHKLDPQTLRASLDITLNFSLPEPATLFSIGPATITLDGCVFDAQVHIEGGVGQAASRTSQGSITGNWFVEIAGTGIVTFVATSLSFDAAGHLHFAISPDRVQLNGALSFLAGFLQETGLGGKGFSLNLLPAGVQCVLDLPFPDCSFGAFGITNLRLGSLFELDVSNGLKITVGANLGRKTAPFTLTIFILGGAGWFDAGLTYDTATGQLTADVSIGILASASLSISLGPISGGIYVYFGITAEFHSGNGGGGLSIGILLSMEGRVSLLGIIDADILLLLEADYTSGGGLVGRGRISISIKICWCFTLSVSTGVEYTFGNAPAPSHAVQPAAPLRLAAANFAPGSFAAANLRTVPTAPDFTNYAQSAVNRINFLS